MAEKKPSKPKLEELCTNLLTDLGKEQEILHKEHASQDFSIRFNALQAVYLRCSEVNKIKLLGAVFRNIENLSSQLGWSQLLLACYYDKMIGYADVLKPVNLMPNDRKLLDHDRALTKTTLQDNMITTIQWFVQLNKDIQCSIFYTLFLMTDMRTRRDFVRGLLENFTSKPLVESETDFQLSTGKSVRKHDESISTELSSLRKHWNDEMKKYRRKVFGRKKSKSPTRRKGKGKKGKSGKSSKNSKSSKSKKSKGSKQSTKSKKSKKSRSTKSSKRKKKKSADRDYIQILPITVVKKIFSYLPRKVLNKIKAVNAYWKYAIESLLEDVKGRKMLNKMIKKLESEITEPAEIDQPIMFKPKKMLTERMEREGACSKKVSKRLVVKEQETDSILQAVIDEVSRMQSLLNEVKKRLHEYLNMVPKLQTFPRMKPTIKDLYNIYNAPNCIKTEMGIIKKPPLSILNPIGHIQIEQHHGIINPHNSFAEVEGGEDDEYAVIFGEVEREIEKVNIPVSGMFSPTLI